MVLGEELSMIHPVIIMIVIVATMAIIAELKPLTSLEEPSTHIQDTIVHDIIKTEVGNVLNITNFPYVDYYMCASLYMHSGMKVISPERQLQGICIMHFTKKHAYMAASC